MKNIKSKTPFIRLFFFLFLFLFSCKTGKNSTAKTEPPVTLGNMLACYQTTTWDSLSIHTRLAGKWEWEYIRCYWNPENGNYKDFLGLIIEFKQDNTLNVIKNGQTTQTSKWEVVKLNDGFFSLYTTPLVLQLPGKILFCNNRVLFFDSYVDGCDNYFKRKE